MYFRIYGPQNTWLINFLQCPISEHRSTGNMVNEPKHCCNLNDSNLIIIIDHCEDNCVGKSLS